ncbi:hypothetical protein OC926_08925 [Pseudomonas peradeniyensis]|uniref:hypothetical protein n=1 Tax=Pseudomonas TaxID=286 RepID=UPI000AFBBA3B|nr:MULTISPECIES: hypothetical protein [Pseudomonas]MCU7279958.1 hypothetical protein [Pseudomonas peradeniyensis]QZA54056.1 hypothetical protein K2O50_24285 [Pseudomonas sp. 2hn]
MDKIVPCIAPFDLILSPPQAKLNWNTTSAWSMRTQGQVEIENYVTDEWQMAKELTLLGECDVTIDFGRLVHGLSFELDICRFGKGISQAYWLELYDGESVFVRGPGQYGRHVHTLDRPVLSLTICTWPRSVVRLRELQWSLVQLQ